LSEEGFYLFASTELKYKKLVLKAFQVEKKGNLKSIFLPQNQLFGPEPETL